MITIDFAKRGKTGLSDFLSASIRAQILAGTITADERLPSKRSLADHLGVSVVTVQNAYARLLTEGYLYSVEKKGFFASDINTVVTVREKDGAASHAEEPAGIAEMHSPAWKTDFSSNATGFEKFPFSLWAKTMRSVLVSGNKRLLQKTDAQGIRELREAIASHLYAFREMQVAPEQIVVGAGTESLYATLIQLLGRGKRYALEDPGYRKIALVMALNGAECVHVAIDGAGMDVAALARTGADVAHVSPSHHFPTGIVMPVWRRRELLAWAGAVDGRYIIEDDYDSEFRFTGKPLPTLQSAGESTVIYLNTFTKTLAPSFRISYMVLPAWLVERFGELFAGFSCPVSAFEQFTLARFISEGHFARHIIRMKNYYRSVRNELEHALSAHLPAGSVQLHEEEAGLHFLLSLDKRYDADAVHGALAAAGINLPRLRDFYAVASAPGMSASGVFVVNYSGLQKQDIARTADVLSAVLQKSLR